MNYYSSLPFFLLFFYKIYNYLLRNLIYACKRFVHKVQIRFLCYKPCYKYPLSLSAGKLGYLPVLKLIHSYPFKCSLRLFPVLPFRMPEPAKMYIPSHKYHIHNRSRKIPVYLRSLRNIGYFLLNLFKRFSHNQNFTRKFLLKSQYSLY